MLGAIRARDVATMLRISDEISEQLVLSASGEVYPATEYPDSETFGLGLQLVALVGKYQYPSGRVPGLDPKARAIADFREAERRNRRLNIVFRAHRERGTDRHWSVPLVRKLFLRVLGDTPFMERILDRCDFSGGASICNTGTRTHLAAKLGGARIAGGSNALGHFKLAMWRNPNYRAQFMLWKNSFECVDRNYMVAAINARFEVCEYNKIEVVTKNAKSGRTIAKESEINNCLQKGVDLEMRDLLRTHLGIDLRFQEPNQQRARKGAALWEEADEDVTIDVRGASNSVITEAIRSVSPARWFTLLDQLRSPYYELNGAVYPYEMFCSMGNGFCFPLETLLFAAICHAAYKHAGLRPDYRCYGDDIVVKRSVALVVIECLRAFGFRVNIDKTYVHGPFRESCGANSYGGQEVTPGYYKEPITTIDELYARHNSLAKWPKVQAVMRSFVRNGHYVPDLPRYSWVSDQAFRVPLDIAMSSPGVHWNRHLQGWFSTVYTTRPKPDNKWLERFKGSNPEQMVLTAVLRGAQSSDEPFYLRHTVERDVKRLDSTGSVRATRQLFQDDPSHTLHHAHVVQWQRERGATVRLHQAHVAAWLTAKGKMYAHLRRPLIEAVRLLKPVLVPGACDDSVA